MKRWIADHDAELWLGGLIAATVVLAIWLVWAIYQHSLWHAQHHCEATGESWTETLIQAYSFDSKTTTYIPQIITHNEYACDVGRHWD